VFEHGAPGSLPDAHFAGHSCGGHDAFLKLLLRGLDSDKRKELLRYPDRIDDATWRQVGALSIRLEELIETIGVVVCKADGGPVRREAYRLQAKHKLGAFDAATS
jgi:hypothetical protein